MNKIAVTKTVSSPLSGEPNVINMGPLFTRLGIALLFGWIGAMKFTVYEAEAISGLVASSPLTSWLYALFTIPMASAVIGVAELLAAFLLLVGIVRPALGVAGGSVIVGTLIITSSFLLTAPITEASLGGFPALSVLPGQFLLKDIALLGAAIWLFLHDFAAAAQR